MLSESVIFYLCKFEATINQSYFKIFFFDFFEYFLVFNYSNSLRNRCFMEKDWIIVSYFLTHLNINPDMCICDLIELYTIATELFWKITRIWFGRIGRMMQNLTILPNKKWIVHSTLVVLWLPLNGLESTANCRILKFFRSWLIKTVDFPYVGSSCQYFVINRVWNHLLKMSSKSDRQKYVEIRPGIRYIYETIERQYRLDCI